MTKGQSVSFYPEADKIGTQQALVHPGSVSVSNPKRQLIITLAALQATSADVTISGVTEHLTLGSGLFHYETAPLPVPETVTVTATADSPVFLTWLDMATPTGAAGLQEDDNVILLHTDLRQLDDNTVRMNLQWAGGGDPSRLFWFGVNASGRTRTDNQWFNLGWWGIPMPANDMHMEINLLNRDSKADADGAGLEVYTTQLPMRDGDYTVTLSVWEQGLSQKRWPTPFVPLWRFQSDGQRVTDLKGQSTQLAIFSLETPRE
jgi:hypothetical protein